MGRSMQPGNGSTSTYVIASTSLYFVTILLTALFHLRKDVIWTQSKETIAQKWTQVGQVRFHGVMCERDFFGSSAALREL